MRRRATLSSGNPDPAAVAAFAADLRHSFPGVDVDETIFQSGAVFIHTRWKQRAWVLMYSPQHDSYGIDELGDDEGFTTGYAHTAESFDEACQVLLDLLRAAESSEPKR